ncbi:basic leucine zipper 43-like [Momordica charantia]|uniref:Basic leucine zipper 43-like n=1 Tax=Momordica charantia TaxID=3673 RepID=A0A6J1D3H0_MOMCH|nr:basic leucine zipper 43-like [Momordica charantia]XP_022148646.1 basic leucine zipper 43-like [Momordica charantia]
MRKANQNSNPIKGEQAYSSDDSSTSEEQISSLTSLDENVSSSQDDRSHDDLKFQKFKLSLRSNVILEDYEEIRNEKRKQANRAKRSRLRKQKEMKELEAITNTLREEISILTMQMKTLLEDCVALMEENASLMDELEKQCGPEAVDDLETANSYRGDK